MPSCLDSSSPGVSGAFWASGEWIEADVDLEAPTRQSATANGAYLQAGYFLTGEHRGFKQSAGAFDRTKTKSNFLENGRGAWEIAARYSTIDLNDVGLGGGEQDSLTLAVNWYLNNFTRVMLNWVRADVEELGEADFALLRFGIDF